jgi:hypothetical protein
MVENEKNLRWVSQFSADCWILSLITKNTKFFCKCWGTDPHQMLADVLTQYEMRESINTRDLFDTGTVFPVSNLSVVEIGI